MILKEGLKMPAVSKAQQRFFGMVRSAQKGEMKNPSSEILDVADDISVKDAKKFAKTKHKGLPEKRKMKENVTLQDANGNDFIEIIDLIKPEPLVKKEEDDYSTRDRELKRTKKGRDQRYKTLHKGTNDQNNVDVNEDVSYKEFTAKAREISSKVKKEKQEKQKRNADSAYRDKVTKGVRFYDKKGKGHIRNGKKVYS